MAGLPAQVEQAATPEQANAVPIFDFLEGVLRQQLEAVLPAGTTLATVP
ncbi:hypothetical protein [Hymenobacter ruricola]|uniref:Uncharacterized protein n=1 Tax=Hymenobacter ruricola TaxID=2791023 RepID=A0ABS0I7Q8_9BACT|nr:hypothetical protein [Hymenobacter ruricola]MBF9223006.1 hypothetical protein [Hymenobacter ruricola]